MINNLDDIVEAITDVIDHTPPLLRNRELFYAAAEIAFCDYECKIRHDARESFRDALKRHRNVK